MALHLGIVSLTNSNRVIANINFLRESGMEMNIRYDELYWTLRDAKAVKRKHRAHRQGPTSTVSISLSVRLSSCYYGGSKSLWPTLQFHGQTEPSGLSQCNAQVQVSADSK
jgi:hypothetical protein